MLDHAACRCADTIDRLLLSDTLRRKRNELALRRKQPMVPGKLEHPDSIAT